MKKVIWLIILGMCASGCATLEKGGFVTPVPAQSEYFRTTGAGFSFTIGDPDSIKYNISLDVIKPRERNIFIETQFEDPSLPKSPIIATRTIQPEESSITVESPPIYGLCAYEGYIIDIFIYESAEKGRLLGKHRQVVRSIIDQKLISKK